jgi:hypothetical protein
MNSPSDPLDELLDRCRSVPDLPPHLVANVRRRIAADAAQRSLGWMTRLDAVFARPSFAATFVAACVLLGLFLAEARVSRLQAARTTEVARSYLQLIDPLLPPSATPPVSTATTAGSP